MSRHLYAYSGFGDDSQGTIQCPANRVFDPQRGVCVRRKILFSYPTSSSNSNTMTYVAIGGAALVAAYFILR